MISTDQLPHAVDSEKYILGTLVQFPSDAPEVFDRLRGRDFIDPMHRAIFDVFGRQHLSGGIDPVLAAAELKGRSVFADLEPAVVLYDLGNKVATGAHVAHEAGKIVEASRKRQRIEGLEIALDHACNGHTVEQIDNELFATAEDWRRESAGESRERFTFAELRYEHPTLNPPIVDGLLREGETANIIAPVKFGKSWAAYSLALSITTGQPWLGQFCTAQGKVLLIDPELHKSTLANRIQSVGNAMGIPNDDYFHDLEILSLRGKRRSIHDLAFDLSQIDPHDFRLMIFDAKYRFLSAGASENDNAAEAEFYNLADQIADKSKSALVFIHHSSKGGQADKRVTDVGSGAGAQSRAADCHLVLREHEEEGVCVLDAAVRSFAPVEPLALRWNFPLWVPASGVDPGNLKGRKTRAEERQNDKDKEGMDQIVKALREGAATARKLRTKTGMGKERQERLLDWMTANGHATITETKVKGNVCYEYQLTE